MAKTFVFVGDVKVGEPLAQSLTAAGFAAASDVAAADVVFTFCDAQATTEDVYFETNGLIQTCAPGALLIDLGPTSPSFAREIEAVALVNDLRAIDAPLFVADVTLSDAFARPENLRAFVGGDELAAADARPLLEAIAGEVSYQGPAGSGQMAKAAVALQEAAQFAALIEADALCRAAKADSEAAMAQAIAAGVTSPRAAALHRAVCERRFDGAFTLEMLMAELTMALTAADDVDLILPQGEAAQHLLELLAVIGGADKGVAALSLIYGEESECAKYGLDWTRAEQIYGEGHDDDECGCGHHHDEDDYDDFDPMDGLDPFDDYSRN